ncbi:unnamed protein product [Pseudo-nitzschia multistriata]|uniref:Uncharacterized protein n=1 Tax=Pseudo-nitzschia multistriata TaxID=183589 RepID=A0A448ZK20_9STRA|nr:unnamed protein product [Pseudo-nitzschia multistriata]
MKSNMTQPMINVKIEVNRDTDEISSCIRAHYDVHLLNFYKEKKGSHQLSGPAITTTHSKRYYGMESRVDIGNRPTRTVKLPHTLHSRRLLYSSTNVTETHLRVKNVYPD